MWFRATLRSGWSVCIGSGRVLSASTCICHAGWLQLKPHCQEQGGICATLCLFVWFFLFSVFNQHHPRIHEFLGHSWAHRASGVYPQLPWNEGPTQMPQLKLSWVGLESLRSWRTELKCLKVEWKESFVSLRSCCNINLIVLGVLSNAVEASSPLHQKYV